MVPAIEIISCRMTPEGVAVLWRPWPSSPARFCGAPNWIAALRSIHRELQELQPDIEADLWLAVLVQTLRAIWRRDP